MTMHTREERTVEKVFRRAAQAAQRCGSTFATYGQLWPGVLQMHVVQVAGGKEGAGNESSGIHERRSALGLQPHRGFTSH